MVLLYHYESLPGAVPMLITNKTLKTMENHSLQNILLSASFLLHRNGSQGTSSPAAMSFLANSWTHALLREEKAGPLVSCAC